MAATLYRPGVSRHTTIVPRRKPRTPSPTERVVGVVLLLILAGLAALFLLAGAGAGPAGLPEPAAEASAGALPLTSPAGWPRGEIERYDAGNLFEKIDGKDAAYLAYDVVGLEFASYADPADPTVYADVYLYDLGEPLNAFGVFRAQRTGDEAGVDLGEEGAGGGAALFARKGRHYLEVVGSGPAAGAEVRALAGAICDALPASAAPVTVPPWFAPEMLASVRYVRREALGMESLGDAWIAAYEDGLQVVVAKCASPQAAEAAAKEARDNFGFLGTPAEFGAEREYAFGVVGQAEEARRLSLYSGVRFVLRGDR